MTRKKLLREARQHLRSAHERIDDLPPALVPAFLPLATVPLMLARLERGGPFGVAEIAPWRRQWLIWRAAQRPGRLFS